MTKTVAKTIPMSFLKLSTSSMMKLAEQSSIKLISAKRMNDKILFSTATLEDAAKFVAAISAITTVTSSVTFYASLNRAVGAMDAVLEDGWGREGPYRVKFLDHLNGRR